jgi:predicted RNase H-like HicB family nuclease
MKNDSFDGYAVRLTLDEEGDWLAALAELPNVSAFADTPRKAIEELRVAWSGVKESYRKHGEIIPLP